MPPLIRLLPLGEGDRRRSPRFLVTPEEPLFAGVAVMGGDEPRTLTGRVRDISETGLSLFLPTDEACGELTERDCPLAVVLTLPAGTIRLRAAVAHCAAPDVGHPERGYVVGVRITEIGADDYARLVEYISEGSGREPG